jgi:hypothetical protein
MPKNKFQPNCRVQVKPNTQAFKLQSIFICNKLDVRIKEILIEHECDAVFKRHGALASYIQLNNEELIVDPSRLIALENLHEET